MNKYYKLDSLKLTYGEYWNLLRSWQVLIPWTAKLLHLRLNLGSPLPYFESVRDLEVPEAAFDARAREKLQPLLDQSLAAGFHSPRFFSYGSMKGDSRTWFMALLHPSAVTVRLMYSVGLKVQPPKEKVLVALLSELRDGTFLVTSGQRKQFHTAPSIEVNRLLGASPERLFESHLQKLHDLPMSNPAKAVCNTDMLDDLWDRYERLCQEFGLRRGIYVWMAPEEVTKEETALAEAKAMTGDSGQNVDVMLAINELRSKKTGWGGLITIFIISLLLFVIAGQRQWKWDYLVILLGVLFVHELGHYLAMRAFRYQNVRMFFIPFFGAAVSGHHYNVAGWKKVVVSLMGPLPGIALGVLMGVVGMVLHQGLLLKIGVVSLILNGSNLLPVLPLDGGWVFHNLIFTRHYVLDMIFRILAAVVLLSSAVFLHSKILPYVGFVMLIGVPAAYRMARIAKGLKERGLPSVAEDQQDIPPETAQVIIAEVKQAAKRPLATKMVAEQTLQIFETLNARPPGWGATLGLLFVHAIGFGMAVVFALAFIVAQRGDLSDWLSSAARIPKHTLVAGAGRVWNESAQPAKGITLVATFDRPAAAAALFQDVTNQLPEAASLKLFGESVLLSLPFGQDDLRRQWLAAFQARTENVFADSTNYHAAFSLLCVAPDTNAAEAIVNEINGYFRTLPEESLIPPWFVSAARTSSESAANAAARQMYLRLENAQTDFFKNPELAALEKKFDLARTQGDETAANRLQRQIESMMETLHHQNLERVRRSGNGTADETVFELFTNLNAPATLTNHVASEGLRQQLAKLLGQFTVTNGADAKAEQRFSAHFGAATRKGLIVNVNFVSFYSLEDGPAALVEWLEQKGCIGLRYDFYPGEAYGAESD